MAIIVVSLITHINVLIVAALQRNEQFQRDPTNFLRTEHELCRAIKEGLGLRATQVYEDIRRDGQVCLSVIFLQRISVRAQPQSNVFAKFGNSY